MRLALAVTALACSAVACAKEQPKADSAQAASAGTTAQKVGEIAGFKVPESVKYDAELDVYYVSNINGNPSQKDGNGYIARVRADSTSVVTMLAEGGKNGVTLNAPKGMALSGDTLFVADIDALRLFNRRTGAPLGTIDFATQKATFLNDVTRTPDGDIWVTDTGISFDASGNMTHPGVNRIFRVSKGKVTPAIAAPNADFANPNGITWMAASGGQVGQFILAPFGGKDVQSFRVGPQQTPTSIVSGPGQYDGVEVLPDGRILVSSWADSSVNVIHTSVTNGLLSGHLMPLVKGVPAPADIGVDTKRNLVAIPLFNDGKVVLYSIP